MSEPFARPKGTFDILPTSWCKELWKDSSLWQRLEHALHTTAKRWGFEEMRTPIFETTSLFQRGVGESSDIVSKEMYTFADRANRSLTLRPEGTLGTIRAVVENGGQPGSPHYRPVHRLYYLGPMFRYERPQAGRYRQFHQFGVEAIGLASWQSDVEILQLVLDICKNAGLPNVELQINTLGDAADRERFKTALRDYLATRAGQLSEDSSRRLELNPLRILDSKDSNDLQILQNAPRLEDHLSTDSLERYAKIRDLLDHLAISHVHNPSLVRGLDYYSHLVFEVTSQALGAQSSIAGGGRYGGLFSMLDQPDRPAVGFGMGMERMVHVLSQTRAQELVSACDAYLIGIGPSAQKALFLAGQQWREQGLRIIVHTEEGKLQRALQLANDTNARFVVLAGESELQEGGAKLKNMQTRSEQFYPFHLIAEQLRKEISKSAPNKI